VYFALAECFKEPTLEFAREVASGLLRDGLCEAFAEMGLSLDAGGLHEAGADEEVFERLRSAYHAIFIVPSSRFVLPVESVFKEWRAGGSLGVASGMIMGPPALDMVERYRARGLQIPAGMKDYPDHLTLLLEYGRLLCQEGNLQEQRKFVASHLDQWIEVLADQVEALSEIPFYGTVARALRAFVRAERRQLGLADSA
jgi:TorA maturation chaperone TorD